VCPARDGSGHHAAEMKIPESANKSCLSYCAGPNNPKCQVNCRTWFTTGSTLMALSLATPDERAATFVGRGADALWVGAQAVFVT
jgi:hypothetical protein